MTLLVIDAQGRKWKDFDLKSPYRWYDEVIDNLICWWRTRSIRRRHAEFKRTGTRYYGNGGTIHTSGHLDVETFRGTVVAVWFRCQPLPFEQSEVDGPRATDMQQMGGWPESGRPYGDNGIRICGVEVADPV